MKKASIIAKLGAAAMAAVMACSSIAASAATVPNATIDTTRKTSLELYKYDFTTAHEDGVLNTDSYISTGLPDDAVEEVLAPYAIQGVVFTYTKVADVTTYSALEADGYKDMVLYAMRTERTAAISTSSPMFSSTAFPVSSQPSRARQRTLLRSL